MQTFSDSLPVNPQRIKEIKRRAKQMSRSVPDQTYMQCLDIVCREQMGLRHFHHAQKLAAKKIQQPRSSKPFSSNSGSSKPGSSKNEQESPWTLYLQACQEAYFEL